MSLAHPLIIRYHLRPDQISLFLGRPQVYAIWRPGDASTLLVGVSPSPPSKPLAPPVKHKTGVQNTRTPTATTQKPPAPPAQQLQYATPDQSNLTWTISTSLSGGNSSIVSSSSNITFGTQTPQALWGTPQDFQVGLNSGGLTYTYPSQLPPGPGGFAPPLNLTYSSGAVSESHNLQAAAPWVGEGWNLSLGAITWSQEDVTPGNGDRMESVWNISDPSGISGQLIPPDLNYSTIPPYDPVPQNLGTGTIWHSAPESHAKIQEIAGQGGGYPCWRVYLPNGIMEEFGCNDTVGSDQSYKVNENWYRYRWDLDLMVDPYGNQIHFNYQRIWDQSHSWIQDAVLSDIEYDDPNCHQFAYCTSWNPQIKIVFDANPKVSNLTGGNCGSYSSTTQRCDDPIDLSGSGGLPAPHVMNSYALNDIQILAQGNLLHKYVFSYEQIAPNNNYTDPLSGEKESVAGYLDLTKIDELGTGGNAPPSAYPEVNITYGTETQRYIDTYLYASPYNNCPSWVPIYQGTCLLWSASQNARYITTLDNGRGWHENITWIEARNNTRGVDSGSASDAFACTGQFNQGTRCIEADDHAWSREVVGKRDAISNEVTSTWWYHYALTTGLGANAPGWPDCSNSPCTQGATWGDQNDGDYADYYNSQFMSYAQATSITPDGAFHVDDFGSTNGWGIAKSGIYCPPGKTCQLAPYWGSSTDIAGKLTEQDDWDNQEKILQRVQKWTYDLRSTGRP